MARRIPGARLVMLPGGHLSNLEQPQPFNAAVLEFLQTVERSS
jgi:3-oxoadipate enol-lactonase